MRHFHTVNRCAELEWEMEHFAHLSAPWTESLPNPRIVNQLVGGHHYSVDLRKFWSLYNAERGLSEISFYSALSLRDEGGS
jgi:hypothetical protein